MLLLLFEVKRLLFFFSTVKVVLHARVIVFCLLIDKYWLQVLAHLCQGFVKLYQVRSSTLILQVLFRVQGKSKGISCHRNWIVMMIHRFPH